jgi:hypothetical protein
LTVYPVNTNISEIAACNILIVGKLEKGETKMNCWEFKKCGQETHGLKAKELDVCPVYPNHGTHCARIVGTLCGGKVQGVATKLRNCMECEFYKSTNYDRTWNG